MHNADDFTHPPARRYAGLALIRNTGGDVLFVEKAYKEGLERLGLPGGSARQGESAAAAAQREVEEELGLKLIPGRVLTVHYMPASGLVREGTNLVFDFKVIEKDTAFTLPENELVGVHWLAPSTILSRVAPYNAWRVHAALESVQGGDVQYLVGHPTFPMAELVA
ncbi:NUDIX domain-containing protein [Streptomyces sp. SBT349]|uniref:NUDIX domain-containing protein n=1 Tax=Streptomyces sp. SBT349 TaxID=1580539 RepID=UPI00066C438E|nr:NUDIX hydrolase [Streptomyces sp. SBT349]